MDLSYVMYDTAIFGVTALNENILFGVTQQTDTVHQEYFTNSRGASTFPNGEKFVIEEIAVWADYNLPIADVQNMWVRSFLEIRVQDLIRFKAPLVMCAAYNSYGGHFTQAVAADEAIVGVQGKGLKLDIPIEVEGGVSWRVRVVQGTALAGAGREIKCALKGILTLP